jgi:Uma2 family endonuclease
MDNVLEKVAIPDKDAMIFSGKIVAEDVPYADYLSKRYGKFVEWIHGVVIEMAPINLQHANITRFLRTLFDIYLELITGGKVLGNPFVMRPGEDFPARQPDIQVILPDRLEYVKENQVAGPANLVVEVVSPESVKRDLGEKFQEYEKGGVDEYWILDPMREEALFYVRDENGIFRSRPPVDGVYASHVLNRLSLPVALLWQEKLPTVREAVRMVEAMLESTGGAQGEYELAYG